MSEEFRSFLIGTAGLCVAALIALLLALSRFRFDASAPEVRAAVRMAILTVLFQAAHFAEELATGFHQRFPEILGLVPWSIRVFAWFNLLWLIIWGLSIWGLAARWRIALLGLWFLGVACAANGLAHPGLAVRAGGYFPGLITSPLVGIAGIMLLQRLFRITIPTPNPAA